MANDVTLSKGVRANLLSLQQTAEMMARTQERLSTGKKVNSALDNPVNYFTSAGLQARASDLSTLLDSIGNGVQTLAAADKGITAITKLEMPLARPSRKVLTATSAPALQYCLKNTGKKPAMTVVANAELAQSYSAQDSTGRRNRTDRRRVLMRAA